mmetsp:Transcript_2384/g.7614  ORF Transcript_2384/g.7614 Transcript_2384/m.7614 type:complete len:526 (-) Transcript_2384:693-2270(-)
MSAYGFGGQSVTQKSGVDATLAKKLSRWEHHRSETSDAFESVEKASKQFQECCASKASRIVSAEEKIRSRNIFKREYERFKDALEKLENCLTMGANSARDFADRQKILLGFTEKKRIFVAQMEADDERSSLLSSSSSNNNNSARIIKRGKKLRVAVLLSGGVDSSVALSLLRAAGHECVAFYLQIWFQDDFRNFWDQCPWEEDVMVAKRVCERLRVPLRTVHFTDDYWNLVVKQSVEEIQRGKTPNPDILCNSRVKFGAFREWLDTNEEEIGTFDRIASGHYAALERKEDDETDVKLVASGDARKDQTYFLAHLSSWQLQKAMFPIGGISKPRIREIAENLSLVNADRKDSQGICFLGKVKFSEFIEEHLGTKPGEIREIESGELLGTHKGFWFHTVGQRQGLKLDKRAHEGPWYVHSKDVEKNVVFISRAYHSEENERERDSFECEDLSWCRDSDADQLSRIERCKVRHGESYYRVLHVEPTTPNTAENQKLKIKIDGKDQGLAKGQYAVFYGGSECLGCGVIC